MSLISGVKRSSQLVTRGLTALRGPRGPATLDGNPRNSVFEFHLPNPFGGEPLYRAQIALTRTRHAQGETVRLQAHMNGCLSLPATHDETTALPAPATGTGLVRHGRNAASGMLRFGLSRLPAGLVAPLLQQRLQTWIDIKASTAPLAAGAEALLPESLRALMRDVPRAGAGEPRVAGWMGDIEGPHPGVAQLTFLQMDQTDLPPELRTKPFNLTASVASTLVDESR